MIAKTDPRRVPISSAVSTDTSNILTAISDKYYISGILFIVPIVVIIMIVRKIPAIPALLIGTLLGSVFAIIFQPKLVLEVSEQVSYNGKLFDSLFGNLPVFTKMFMGTIQSLFGDISINTSNEMVNELLSAGGMKGMLGTIWLIISAMIFGGVMEKAGFLKRMAKAIISVVNSTGSLVASTVGTCVFFNITASDQYLAIVVPGRMYADIYKSKGLAAQNLSRSLEDSGTVTSVLVPWNTCGAYHSSVLDVSTLVYAPFAFFNLISPFMSIFYAYAGIKIKRLVKKEQEN
jgi:NhaC family Na+:H+ antiporter